MSGPGWKAEDLTGNGSALYPGRWNHDGEHVVYATTTIALAVLETAAHIDVSGLPIQRYVIEINVPDAIWQTRKSLTVSRLRSGWDAIPSGHVSRETGTRWYNQGQQVLLQVPSVIVPEEPIVLIHAKHPEAGRLKAKSLRPFDYDLLFRR